MALNKSAIFKNGKSCWHVDYCVKFTALDAVQYGFKTFFIEDASRGVNLQPNDVKDAIAEMNRAGIATMRSADLLQTRRAK